MTMKLTEEYEVCGIKYVSYQVDGITYTMTKSRFQFLKKLDALGVRGKEKKELEELIDQISSDYAAELEIE